MATIYVNCPKCDDEFEFKMTCGCDRTIEFREETQRCSCPISEDELDGLRDKAAEKYNELDSY